MRKEKRIMQRLLTTLLCLALCTADIIPTGMTVLAQEQEVQPDQEETDTAGKDDQVSEEEIEAAEPEENEPPVIAGNEEEAALPVEEEPESVSEEEQTSVSENATEEELDSVSENTVEEELNVNSAMEISEDDPIASGTSNDISWVIDADGKLTVTGTGDFERMDDEFDDEYNTTVSAVPWYDYRELIKTTMVEVTGMQDASYMFYGCKNLTSIDLTKFDTGSVTDMRQMFHGCESLTTLDLSKFNTSSVTDMHYMFDGCYNLTTLDLSSFDTSNVTNMNHMFGWCTNLTTLDLSSFDTSNVTDMTEMFFYCEKLTTLDVSHFNTSKVWSMYWMFGNCNNLTTLDLSGFDFQNVNNATDMFYFDDNSRSYIFNLTNIYTPCNLSQSIKLPSNPGDKWYLPNGDMVTELPQNLNYSVALKRIAADIASGTSGNITWVIDAYGKLTVSGTGDFERIDIGYDRMGAPWYNDSRWIKTAEISVTGMTDASYMFADCTQLTSVDLTNFDTSSVTNMSNMFFFCWQLTTLDVSNFNTSNVTDMSGMFDICQRLTTLDVSNFDTGSVTDMREMFSNCYCLTTLDLSNFNTSNVTDMGGMFLNCHELTTLDVSNFNTSNVTDMGLMFMACENLNTLDLSSFDMQKVRTINIFNANNLSHPSNLTCIYTPRNLWIPVSLPSNSGDIWYRSDGTVVTELPKFLSYSVALGKNHTPIEKTPDDPEDDPNDPDDPDDNDDGILPEDIPDDGVIPEGLWNSKIADQTYTGTAIKPEVRVYDGEKRLKQGTDYTLSYLNNTKAAQASDDKPPTVVVKGKGNYAGTESKTFTITKRSISDTHVTKTFTNAYTPLTNGRNPNLVFSAKCNNRALKKNTDYTLTVKDSTGKEVTSYGAAGTYTAVVKGAGNFTGEYSFSFEVLNKVPVSKLKIGKIATINYDGTSKTPEPVIKYGKKTLTKETDYTLSYLNNTAIGTAEIVITGKGEYFGTRNVTFSIAGLPIRKAKLSGFQTSFPYTGAEVRQTGTVLKYGDEELKENRDYTVSYSNHRNKGKAAVTYTGIGKYTGTLKKTYSITAYNITKDDQKRIKLSTDAISAVYAKGGARPSLKVYDGTRLLTEGTDYTLTYQNNAAVTTSATLRQPTITVKGKGNYTGTLSEKKTFTITAKNIAEVTATAPDAAVSTRIGKYKSTPVLTDTNGKKLKAGTDYDRAYTYTYNTTTEKVHNNGAEVTRNAGDPVDALDIVPANTVLCVHVTAKGNYTGETTAEYRIAATLINKAKITVKNPAQNNTNLFPYTGQAIRLEKSCLTVKVGRDVLSDNQYEILEDTYKNNVGKGTASVQIKGVGNYGGTATVKFKIGTKGFQWVKRLFG